MKSMNLYSVMACKALFLIIMGASTSCSRSTNQVWDDTKSCGRHFTRGVKALTGRPVYSRQVQSRDEFIYWQEPQLVADPVNYHESEFIPIPRENPNEIAMADKIVPQPRETPGDVNSPIPGIDAFSDPATQADLKNIFRNIHFDYNSHLVKGTSNLETIQAIANYMKSHPNLYVFVEGHCDERGPEAYNLALGARRSNAVRNALVQNGVNGDHLFTISYGKERPLVLESNEDAWSKNRRAEFKTYQR